MNLEITDRTWVQIKGCFNIIEYCPINIVINNVNISKQLNLDQTKIGNTQWTDICTCMYDVFLIKKKICENERYLKGFLAICFCQ